MCQDQPEDSDEYTLKLELGDVVVTGTDGIFDNLFNHEIHAIVTAYKKEQYDATLRSQPHSVTPCLLHTEEQAFELAKRIVQAARAKVDAGEMNKRVSTPYQRKYRKTYNA